MFFAFISLSLLFFMVSCISLYMNQLLLSSFPHCSLLQSKKMWIKYPLNISFLPHYFVQFYIKQKEFVHECETT